MSPAFQKEPIELPSVRVRKIWDVESLQKGRCQDTAIVIRQLEVGGCQRIRVGEYIYTHQV